MSNHIADVITISSQTVYLNLIFKTYIKAFYNKVSQTINELIQLFVLYCGADSSLHHFHQLFSDLFKTVRFFR